MNAHIDTIDSSQTGTGEVHFAFANFSLGTAVVAASDKGVTAILMGDNEIELQHELLKTFPSARPAAVEAGLEEMMADCSISGYRWGLGRKRKLLNREALA